MMTKKTNKIIIGAISILLILFFAVKVTLWGREVYLNSDDHISSVVTKKTNNILSKHDLSEMKQLASDAKTYNLLKQTSKSTKAENTSGYQGKEDSMPSYTTEIDGKNVNIQITRTGKYDWGIRRIEEQ
ncbi:hypothetical protein IV64_GL000905 [Lactiplantibacillus xiangfangensis]|uniref:Uncharacterized protein n=2 Tax=Lactiplantibacillus xiangfangensis TaxID=942150 RepID=A0A0R2M3U5_9LACO|nr:hypothetical protein IV64_GL000905 [Lactiplantibacillus xiangfangensis]